MKKKKERIMRSKLSLESLLCTYPPPLCVTANKLHVCYTFFKISHNNSLDLVEQLVDGQVE